MSTVDEGRPGDEAGPDDGAGPGDGPRPGDGDGPGDGPGERGPGDGGPEVDGPPETVAADHAPARLSSYAAIGAGLIAALTSAPFALLALPLGFGGVAILASGLVLDANRFRVTMGAAGLFLSVLIAGGFGTPPGLLLVSTAATVLAWNFGQHAIGLGEQIGRNARTRRNEVIHASAATVVAMVGAGLGYAVYSAGGGGRPVAALGMLAVAVVCLTWAIRA